MPSGNSYEYRPNTREKVTLTPLGDSIRISLARTGVYGLVNTAKASRSVAIQLTADEARRLASHLSAMADS